MEFTSDERLYLGSAGLSGSPSGDSGDCGIDRSKNAEFSSRGRVGST